jgi:phosphonate transport system substrate-binding protein
VKGISKTVILLTAGVVIGLLISTGFAILTQPRPTQKLVIAIQPTLAAAEALQRSKPLESFLEQRLGVMMSAWPSYLAWKLAGAEVVLAEVRRVGEGDRLVEKTYYYSYWVVLPDSPIKSLEELRGRKVALPSPISTSGYVAPLAKLVEKGLVRVEGKKEADPSTFFTVVFTGGYAQSWNALKAGDVDATVIAGDIPEDLYRDVMSKVRVVDSQGPIPSHGVVFSKDLKEPLRSKLLQAFLELGEKQPELMRSFISALFVRFEPTTSETHLQALGKYLELTNLKYTEKVG